MRTSSRSRQDGSNPKPSDMNSRLAFLLGAAVLHLLIFVLLCLKVAYTSVRFCSNGRGRRGGVYERSAASNSATCSVGVTCLNPGRTWPKGMQCGNSPDEAAAAELDRLRKKNRELKALVRRLTNGQASLEQRLQRVEDGIIFRFLRWLGGRLMSIGMSVDRGIPTLKRTNGAGPAPDWNYSNWVEEISLHQRVRDSPRSAPVAASPSASDRPRISILLESRRPNRARMERTLS